MSALGAVAGVLGELNKAVQGGHDVGQTLVHRFCGRARGRDEFDGLHSIVGNDRQSLCLCCGIDREDRSNAFFRIGALIVEVKLAGKGERFHDGAFWLLSAAAAFSSCSISTRLFRAHGHYDSTEAMTVLDCWPELRLSV